MGTKYAVTSAPRYVPSDNLLGCNVVSKWHNVAALMFCPCMYCIGCGYVCQFHFALHIPCWSTCLSCKLNVNTWRIVFGFARSILHTRMEFVMKAFDYKRAYLEILFRLAYTTVAIVLSHNMMVFYWIPVPCVLFLSCIRKQVCKPLKSFLSFSKMSPRYSAAIL